MKFKTFSMDMIFLIMGILFIIPCNALEYQLTNYTDFNDINEYSETEFLICGANDYYGTDTVSIFDPIGGTAQMKISNFNDIQCVGYDGTKIYWGDGNFLYMYSGDFLLNGSYHTEGIGQDYTKLATVTSTITDIYVDGIGDIYFTERGSGGTQGYIHKCVPPTYATTAIYHRTSGINSGEIQMCSNQTHFMFIESIYRGTNVAQPYLTILNADYSVLRSAYTKSDVTVGKCGGMFTTTDNNIYYISSSPETDTSHMKLWFMNFSNEYTLETYAQFTEQPTGMIIDSSGIIYVTFETGYIRSYLTKDQIGGYSDFLSSTGLAPASLSYDISNVKSVYDTYFNDSNVVISYNIETELLNNDNENLFNNYMKFRIDLLRGTIPINTEYIETSEFKRSLGYLNIYTLDSEHRYNKGGTITYTPSPNWESGVYNVKLYEITNDTLSQLDIDTYTVLTTESNVSITTTQYTPTGDVSEITNKLMSSNLFYAGIIIMAFTAIGAVYGGVGAAIGGFVGTSISYGVDLIPEWVVLAIVILLIVVGAILFSKSGE